MQVRELLHPEHNGDKIREFIVELDPAIHTSDRHDLIRAKLAPGIPRVGAPISNDAEETHYVYDIEVTPIILRKQYTVRVIGRRLEAPSVGTIRSIGGADWVWDGAEWVMNHTYQLCLRRPTIQRAKDAMHSLSHWINEAPPAIE